MEVAGAAFSGVKGTLHGRFARNAQHAFDPHEQRAEHALTIENLKTELTELAGHLYAGNHRFLVLIAEFDLREGWSDGGTQSCAHWLNWKCGIDMGAAREKVRAARALENLPKISAAMQRGELSYSKVRALTRVACEGTEDYFLSIALHGTADHVENLVRLYRRAAEAAELSREARQQINRHFSFRYDDDGSLVFKGRMPAVSGALLLKALQAAVKEIPAAEGSAETPTVKSPLSARRADALGMLAESFVEHGPVALSGGDRNLVTVHVSAETLRHKTAGCCEIEEGPSIAAETARRLACDASVVAVIENEDGEPLNVGRKTRTISSPLRRFLNARDRGCRFPGCTNTRYVDAHHIHHWADGGETKPSNLVSLCRFHHRKVHEGQVRVVRCESSVVSKEGSQHRAASAHNGQRRTDNRSGDDGALRFTHPNGQSFDSVAPDHVRPFTDWAHLPSEHEERGIHIDERTAATRWSGESMDYGLAVQVLLNQAERARSVLPRDSHSVTAGTSGD